MTHPPTAGVLTLSHIAHGGYVVVKTCFYKCLFLFCEMQVGIKGKGIGLLLDRVSVVLFSHN